MAAKKQPNKTQGQAGKPAGKGSVPPKAASAAPSAPEAVRAAPSMEVRKTHSFRRKLIGLVTSNKMDKTVVVEVNRYSRDRVYKKYVKVRTKYKAHDERNEFKVGDRVEIQEHRPMSREKRFMVVRLVTRAVAE